MNLFLDTSVLLAASGSAKGAARALFRLAPQQGWRLMAIIGHESEAINRHYTHIETATKRTALKKLPKLF